MPAVCSVSLLTALETLLALALALAAEAPWRESVDMRPPLLGCTIWVRRFSARRRSECAWRRLLRRLVAWEGTLVGASG